MSWFRAMIVEILNGAYGVMPAIGSGIRAASSSRSALSVGPGTLSRMTDALFPAEEPA